MEATGLRDLSNGKLGLIDHFSELKDTRMDRTKLHRLDDMVALTIMAVISGANAWTQVEAYGKAKYDWLKTVLYLPNGIPSHDTIGRVFADLDPQAFEQCFLRWVQGLVDQSDVKRLCIDGKTLRRSYDRASNKAAIHMVSAWASKCAMAMGQLATHEKSNEITAIPELLDLLALKGAVVTIDAMGCQRDIAEKIIQGGGDYILAVKDNHPTLHEEIQLLFHDAIESGFEGMGYDYHESTEKGHGRIETRRAWVTRDVDWLRNLGSWHGIRGAVCVESTREILDPAGGPTKKTVQRRYFITSLDHRIRGQDAAWFGALVRGHWAIENQVHWSLDVTFREDDSRIRQGHAAENLSRIRRMALSLLKNEKSTKLGLESKRQKAGWDSQYLLKVLEAGN